MVFNLLTLSVPDVIAGCFSIFWIWAYLTLLQNVFQSFDTERTWQYSGMFFNLLTERTWRYSRTFFNLITLSLPDVTPESFSIFWLWAYLMFLQDVFQSLTLSVPDVTTGCFSIFWLWAYLTLLQDVFQSVDFERTWCYSRMFFNLLKSKDQ
jgi:hypothetical protein